MNKHEEEKMRIIGKKVAIIMEKLKNKLKENETGNNIDKMAGIFMEQENIFSSSREKNFPNNICISLNHVITHGIPNEIKFKSGDLVSLDIACYMIDKKKKKYHADMAITVIIGIEKSKDKRKEKLLEITKKSLEISIESIVPNKTTTRDIGTIIENYAQRENEYYTIKEFGGHGIGNELHERPFIPNFRTIEKGETIRGGMFICIEPLIQENDDLIELSEDKWSIVSKNKNLSAHFEHTIFINKRGAEIITKI